MSEENKIRICLEALEAHKQGDCDRAHELIQDFNDPFSCWIHGMLHREEGDEFNANYWYHKGGRNFSRISIEEEREQIAEALKRES